MPDPIGYRRASTEEERREKRLKIESAVRRGVILAIVLATGLVVAAILLLRCSRYIGQDWYGPTR
jgi:hypothetical protein